jgi:hypothetical protein
MVVDNQINTAVLLQAVQHLAARLDLVGSVTYGRSDSRIEAIEACSHEIAHRIFTGPDFEERLCNLVPRGASSYKLTARRMANRHEASALRIEVVALGRLGCEIRLRTLWARSKFARVDGRNRPPWASMILPLTTREDRSVCTMIRWIRGALAELCCPQRVH